jgi:hypothetical protein
MNGSVLHDKKFAFKVKKKLFSKEKRFGFCDVKAFIE